MFIGYEIYSNLGEADRRIGVVFIYFILAVVILQFLLNFVINKKKFSQKTASLLRTVFIIISVTSFLVLLECSANYWVKFNRKKTVDCFISRI